MLGIYLIGLICAMLVFIVLVELKILHDILVSPAGIAFASMLWPVWTAFAICMVVAFALERAVGWLVKLVTPLVRKLIEYVRMKL